MRGSRIPDPATMLPWRSWYSTARWKKIRSHQLREHPLCQWCLQQGRVRPATIADHIESHGGDYAEFIVGKLQSLCVECHNRKSAGGAARGYSDSIGLDGLPVDPRHPFNASAR
jgi:hypothetical protein